MACAGTLSIITRTPLDAAPTTLNSFPDRPTAGTADDLFVATRDSKVQMFQSSNLTAGPSRTFLLSRDESCPNSTVSAISRWQDPYNSFDELILWRLSPTPCARGMLPRVDLNGGDTLASLDHDFPALRALHPTGGGTLMTASQFQQESTAVWMVDRAGSGGSVAAAYCYTPWAYSGDGPWAVGGNFSQALSLGAPVVAVVADPERTGIVVITADGALLNLASGIDGDFAIRTRNQLIVGSDAYRAALGGILALRWTDGFVLGAVSAVLNGSIGSLFVDLSGARAPLFVPAVTVVAMPGGSGGQGGLIGRDAHNSVLWIAALDNEACLPLVVLVIALDDGITGAPRLRLAETIPLDGIVADGSERVCVETGRAAKPIAAVVHPSGAWMVVALESYGTPGGLLVRVDLPEAQAQPNKLVNLPRKSASKAARRTKQLTASTISATARVWSRTVDEAPAFSAAAAAASVEQVHLSTTERAGELAVVWLSGVGVGCNETVSLGVESETPAQLRFRLVGRGDGWLGIVNATSTCVDTVSGSGWRGVVHRAQIPSLRHYDSTLPSSVEYQVSAPTSDLFASNFSASFVCRQAPTDEVDTFDLDGEGGFSVAVVGDMGATNSEETVGAINAAVGSGAVHALFHNGDIAYESFPFCFVRTARCGVVRWLYQVPLLRYADGDDESSMCKWDTLFRALQPAAAAVPYWVSPGNHEVRYNYSAYKARFAMPSVAGRGVWPDSAAPHADGNLYYVLRYSWLHMIVLSSEHDLRPGSVQHEWLLHSLREARSEQTHRPWLALALHRPLYCSQGSNDYEDTNVDCGAYARALRRRLEPLLARFSVDLVLQAHVHAYERLWPTGPGGSPGSVPHSYDRPSVSVYVMSGAGGCSEGLDTEWPAVAPAWSAAHASVKGFGILKVNRTALAWSFVAAANRSVIDGFVLTK
jgi:hypothetical protein